MKRAGDSKRAKSRAQRALQKSGVASMDTGFGFILGTVLNLCFLIFVTVLKTYRVSPSSSPADRTPTQGGGEEEGETLYLT